MNARDLPLGAEVEAKDGLRLTKVGSDEGAANWRSWLGFYTDDEVDERVDARRAK